MQWKPIDGRILILKIILNIIIKALSEKNQTKTNPLVYLL